MVFLSFDDSNYIISGGLGGWAPSRGSVRTGGDNNDNDYHNHINDDNNNNNELEVMRTDVGESLELVCSVHSNPVSEVIDHHTH